MNPSDLASMTQMSGSFNWMTLVSGIVFGSIGFVAFIYGKKQSLFKHMLIGIALMAYPYLVSGTLPQVLVGLGLTAALFIWRD